MNTQHLLVKWCYVSTPIAEARCDGTKVVLEPEGVHHILKTFKAKSLAQQQTSPSKSS
ncbi:hypothetical protein C8R48DRAFT_430654 [Suillus tomentosus]|nr:hypothetical protein C8R48DRAFT_430654 [Suillus tomentosus]